ncbi:MAG: class I SAM-dependent methyltransferase [Dissulfurispiraceae bacterium]
MEEFDKYADSYETLHAENIRVTGFSPSYFDESKVREIYGYLRGLGREKESLNFLNFGCGIGKSEEFIRRYLPNSALYSIDVSRESIEASKERNRGLKNAVFEVFDGSRIPFENKFGIIFAANVFHHIDFGKHLVVLRNLYERLDNGGVLFLFEHNPLNPLTRRAVNACEFDQDARLLNPSYTGRVLSASGFVWKKLRFTIFFPKFLSFLIPLETYLRHVPFGAQYYYIAGKGRHQPS